MNYDYEFELPLSVTLPRKTKKDRKVYINVNTFRQLQNATYSETKRKYREVVKPQFDGLDQVNGKIHCHYEFYAARNNGPDLDNFVGGAKKFFQDAMVECGFLSEDNVNVICSNSEEYMGVDRKNPRIVCKVQVLGG